MWMFSKDGAHGINKPEPPQTPAQAKALGDQLRETEINRAEVDRILGIPPS